MDIIYFLARYLPFWAVPLALLAFEQSYRGWLKKKKKYSLISLVCAFIFSFMAGFYYYIGGPERIAQFLSSLSKLW